MPDLNTKPVRCEITDLLERECAHCLGIPDAAARTTATYAADARRYTAVWPGKCASCGDGFDAGDHLYGVAGAWLGPCCAPEESPK